MERENLQNACELASRSPEKFLVQSNIMVDSPEGMYFVKITLSFAVLTRQPNPIEMCAIRQMLEIDSLRARRSDCLECRLCAGMVASSRVFYPINVQILIQNADNSSTTLE